MPCATAWASTVALLLSEGQMSDYKGGALLLPALQKAKELLGDRGYDADWFRQPSEKRVLRLAFRPGRTIKLRSNTTGNSTSNATRLKTCSAGSRTGGTSPCVMTVAPTPSSPPSVSPLVIFYLN